MGYIRCLSAGILLFIWNLATNREKFLSIWKCREDVIRLFVFALGGLMLNQYATFRAIQASNAGTATVLQDLSMIIVLAVSCMERRKLPVIIEIAAVFLAFFGTFMLATHGSISSMVLSFDGLFWGLASAAGGACNTLLSRKIVSKYGGIISMTYAFMISGIVFPCITRVWNTPLAVSGSGYAAIAAIVFIGTLFVYAMYLTGIKIIGPLKATMIVAMEPVTATVLSIVWLKTRFEIQDILGFICILLMVFMLTGKDLWLQNRNRK